MPRGEKVRKTSRSDAGRRGGKIGGKRVRELVEAGKRKEKEELEKREKKRE